MSTYSGFLISLVGRRPSTVLKGVLVTVREFLWVRLKKNILVANVRNPSSGRPPYRDQYLMFTDHPVKNSRLEVLRRSMVDSPLQP